MNPYVAVGYSITFIALFSYAAWTQLRAHSLIRQIDQLELVDLREKSDHTNS